MEIAIGGRLLYLNPSLKSLSYAPELARSTPCQSKPPPWFASSLKRRFLGRWGFTATSICRNPFKNEAAPVWHCNIYLTLAPGMAAGKQLGKQGLEMGGDAESIAGFWGFFSWVWVFFFKPTCPRVSSNESLSELPASCMGFLWLKA